MKFSLALAALIVLLAAVASYAEVNPDTLAAWDRYIRSAETRLRAASAPGREFLRIDQMPDQLHRVRRGDVLVVQIQNSDTQRISPGLIHDWVGTVFIPNVTLMDVLTAVRNYDRYSNWYGPTIAQSGLLARNGDQDQFILRYVRSVLFITVVLDTEYVSSYSHVDATRGYSVTRSTRIEEVHDYGKPSQRKTPADDGSGYLWRTYTVSKYQQRDNGVYIEQENIVLSRSIPPAFRWLVEPAIRRLSRNLLEGSLEQTRKIVRELASVR